jgi:hypothetical protein
VQNIAFQLISTRNRQITKTQKKKKYKNEKYFNETKIRQRERKREFGRVLIIFSMQHLEDLCGTFGSYRSSVS